MARHLEPDRKPAFEPGLAADLGADRSGDVPSCSPFCAPIRLKRPTRTTHFVYKTRPAGAA